MLPSIGYFETGDPRPNTHFTCTAVSVRSPVRLGELECLVQASKVSNVVQVIQVITAPAKLGILENTVQLMHVQVPASMSTQAGTGVAF